jgi:hypothetical protein
MEESYNLFRLEFSTYINKLENEHHKKYILQIINSKNSKNVKIDKIRMRLYKIIDMKHYKKYTELVNIQTDKPEQDGGRINNKHRKLLLKQLYYYVDNKQHGGKINKLIHKINKLPNIIKYEINNDRKLCNIHNDNTKCNNNPHCRWVYDECYMSMTSEMIVMCVNRISEELVSNNIKAYEIMQIDNYYVSDIVNRDNFTHTPGEKIIRASSSNIKRILQEIFGTDNIPNIGKKQKNKNLMIDYNELNMKYNVIDMVDIFVQRIIHNDNTLFRTYANGIYWLKNPNYDVNARNLKYYSDTQTYIANKLRVLFIDWLKDKNNYDKITKEMKIEIGMIDNNRKYINNFISKTINEHNTTSNGIIEYTVLSKINNKIPIIIRGKLNNILHIYDDGVHITNPSSDIAKNYDPLKAINIRFQYNGSTSVPDIIDIIYYK